MWNRPVNTGGMLQSLAAGPEVGWYVRDSSRHIRCFPLCGTSETVTSRRCSVRQRPQFSVNCNPESRCSFLAPLGIYPCVLSIIRDGFPAGNIRSLTGVHFCCEVSSISPSPLRIRFLHTIHIHKPGGSYETLFFISLPVIVFLFSRLMTDRARSANSG